MMNIIIYCRNVSMGINVSLEMKPYVESDPTILLILRCDYFVFDLHVIIENQTEFPKASSTKPISLV